MSQPIMSSRIPFLSILAGMLILVPMIVVAGCIGNAPTTGSVAVDGTKWTLTGYLFNGTLVPPQNSTMLTLEFGEDNKISGSAGCNHYFASYEMNNNKITIGQAGSTMMYCPGPGVMEQESTYLRLLAGAVSVSAGRDTLMFMDSTGTTILTFTREIPPAPAPFVGTNWTLDSVYTHDAVSSVISGTTITAVFDESGRVSGTAGCNRYFGPYTVNGSSIAIGSIGSTKMACGETGVMQQETTYLASLGKTAGFAIAGTKLTLTDTKGSPLLSFVKKS